jgi:hypothetical protein
LKTSLLNQYPEQIQLEAIARIVLLKGERCKFRSNTNLIEVPSFTGWGVLAGILAAIDPAVMMIKAIKPRNIRMSFMIEVEKQ